MAWLISYRIEKTYLTDRGITRNAPFDTIDVITLRPEEFILEARKKLLAFQRAEYDPKKGAQSTDDITRIYSAIEIDSGPAKSLRDVL
jgi:hypothetical protein